jgi:hypothetical protein
MMNEPPPARPALPSTRRMLAETGPSSHWLNEAEQLVIPPKPFPPNKLEHENNFLIPNLRGNPNQDG